MEIILGTAYPPDWGGRPKQMSAGDYDIWKRWLALHGEEYQEFYYDVEIRIDQNLPPETAPELVEMWARSTAKRVDVLGYKLTSIELIELRVNASSSTLGAVIAYRSFLRSLLNDPRPVSATIITDHADPTLFSVATENGIKIIEA